MKHFFLILLLLFGCSKKDIPCKEVERQKENKVEMGHFKNSLFPICEKNGKTLISELETFLMRIHNKELRNPEDISSLSISLVKAFQLYDQIGILGFNFSMERIKKAYFSTTNKP